jgi:hypothetical protein
MMALNSLFGERIGEDNGDRWVGEGRFGVFKKSIEVRKRIDGFDLRLSLKWI